MQKQSWIFGKRKTVVQHAYYTFEPLETKILGQKSVFPLDLAPNQLLRTVKNTSSFHIGNPLMKSYDVGSRGNGVLLHHTEVAEFGYFFFLLL